MTNANLNRVNKSSVTEMIINEITQAIIDRKYRPGDKLPTEFELCEILGVGRNSVREAIKVLESYGVVEIKRAEGTFIRSGFSQNLINPLLYSIILAQDDSLESLKELRELIDIGVTDILINKIDEKGKQELEEAYRHLEESVKTGNIRSIIDADNNFHDVMFKLADNNLINQLALLTRRLTFGIIRTTVQTILELGEEESWLKAHRDILDVILTSNKQGVGEVTRESYFYNKEALIKNLKADKDID